VKFFGPAWELELQTLLNGARFVVVPSIWYENFPYVILQSFAAGKPVIGSDRGGIPELVKDNHYGAIYPALNSEALSNKIKELWDDTPRTVSMGLAAKRYVDIEFNDYKFYSNIMGIYEAVIDEGIRR
jgi:glycosyltransferase involved in cell wall biosynthesis